MRQFALSLLASSLLAGLAAGAISAKTYDIDPVHSSVVFRVSHFNVSKVYGRFNEITGKIQFDESNPTAGSVELTIKAASVDTHDDRRDKHLRSPDFLNAAQFPVITFKSKQIEKAGDKFQITGDLTLLGTTKSITIEVEHTGSGKHPRGGQALVGFELNVPLKRSDYGMNFMVGPLGDEIDLYIAIEAFAAK